MFSHYSHPTGRRHESCAKGEETCIETELRIDFRTKAYNLILPVCAPLNDSTPTGGLANRQSEIGSFYYIWFSLSRELRYERTV
jgi:hypothetical protein